MRWRWSPKKSQFRPGAPSAARSWRNARNGAIPVPGPIMIIGAEGSAGIVNPCDFWTKTPTSSPGARRSASIVDATPFRPRPLQLEGDPAHREMDLAGESRPANWRSSTAAAGARPATATNSACDGRAEGNRLRRSSTSQPRIGSSSSIRSRIAPAPRPGRSAEFGEGREQLLGGLRQAAAARQGVAHAQPELHRES